MTETDAAHFVLDALQDVGAAHGGSVLGGMVTADLVNGDRARFTVSTLRDPRPGSVVVADRIVAGDRRRLDQLGANWLDLRGHLKFRHGPMWIDADVPSAPPIRASMGVDPLGGPVVAGVAFSALLGHPAPLPGIRPLARSLDVTPGGVSLAVKRLTKAGLLTRDLRAAVPGLFWAVAESWRPQWLPLAVTPPPGEGLVAIGDQAAELVGAPIGGTDRSLRLLAGGPRDVRRALRSAGEGSPGDPEAWVALAPTPVAARPASGSGRLRGHPVAPPVVIALSLAGDPGRGAEIVRAWEIDGRPW